MVRDEALNENDSGWSFMAGNEGEEYANDYRNLVLMTATWSRGRFRGEASGGTEGLCEL